jgi:DNA-directed RNA polymerase subunit K
MSTVIPMSESYTRYEKARMVGARALQISMGSPTTLPQTDIPKTKDMADPINIALKEFEHGLIPLDVKRGRMINEERKPRTIEE